MKLTTLLLLITTGCSSISSPSTPYERWHKLTADRAALYGKIIPIDEQIEKLFNEENAKCQKLNPATVYGVVNNIGPRCYDMKLFKQPTPSN